MFPITSLSFNARAPDSSDPSDEKSYTLSSEDIALGLQYSDTAGIKPLRDWLYGLQEVSHGRKRGEGWSVFVGNGSQDLIYKVGRLVCSFFFMFWVVEVGFVGCSESC